MITKDEIYAKVEQMYGITPLHRWTTDLWLEVDTVARTWMDRFAAAGIRVIG
jgi:hypothetical protein